MTQACSGLTGSLGGVTWFKTDQTLRDPHSGESIAGYWNSDNNSIVLTAVVVLDGGSVRHEMLHALLRKSGHPRNQFLGGCLGTVNCEGPCITDAGPYPQPPETPIKVTGDSLDISVDIEPRNPDSGGGGGFFSITVLVHNLSTHWVTVPSPVSPISPDANGAHTFEFDVRGPAGAISGGEVRHDPSESIFAPGETKKHVFDFSTGDNFIARQLPPGSYTVHGGYADYLSGDSTFVIGP